MSLVYLNGAYTPLDEARVSVMDRGFTFADGVYEIIPVFNGRILCLDEHLQRLNTSLTAIGIRNPLSADEWQTVFSRLLACQTAGGDFSLYIQVTRGIGERDHVYSDNLQPTVFVMCRPLTNRDFRSGVSAITHEDIRWKYCHIKAITLLPGVLLKKRAAETDGSLDAILIRDGMVTEGAASNVFVVTGGVVKTPPKDGSVLAGITRDLLVRQLHDHGIDCLEISVTEEALRQAEEIWITSSTIGVVPVVRLDGRPVGHGEPGTLWRRVWALYENWKQNL